MAAEKALEMHAFISHNLCACAGWCSNQACRRQKKQAGKTCSEPTKRHGPRQAQEAADQCQARTIDRCSEPAVGGPCQVTEDAQKKKIVARCSERSCRHSGKKEEPAVGGPCQATEDTQKKKIVARCSERSCRHSGKKEEPAVRGPCQATEDAQKKKIVARCSERQEGGASSRGGHGGRPEEEDSRKMQREAAGTAARRRSQQ